MVEPMVRAAAGPSAEDSVLALGASVDPAVVGGKGASLGKLIEAGFRVPPGLVITTAAFREHVALVLLRPSAASALARLPEESARAELAAAVADTALQTSLGADLHAAIKRLAGDRDGAGDWTSFAVRSSAAEEDGTTESFAGLHDTELGVRADDVEAAVGRCWSSVWSRAAVAYRLRKGLPLDAASMAVVIQVLVPADAAVVVFTRHPVTGRDDQLVINALRGLGEPMVSGTATPDMLVVDRATGATVEYVDGDAGERLVATDTGVERGPDAGVGPVLAAAELADLVDLAGRVEASFGAAVDVEAAIAGGQWYLLQARPITTR
ncbi:MAG TPA: PEP/pyruvate-binding domain-containing protein [Candidatus Limnocylindrales bacterium]|nr:PEP/pyruvate-binding domain-containing protein [Candidatus Limnocylindrales bacterium]